MDSPGKNTGVGCYFLLQGIFPTQESNLGLLDCRQIHQLSYESYLTNLDSILKSRDITLPTKVHIVKAMVFLVVLYRCENWTIKKTEHRRIDAFELWCWRRLLRVPWTTGRSNQSILKEINPEYSLEGLMSKLKLQYLTTQWTWVWANSGRWWRTGKPGMLQFTGSQRVGHDLAIEQQEATCPWLNVRLIDYLNIECIT